MRIAVDARELSGSPTGVGRYLSEIVAAWAAAPAAAAHEFIFCTPVAVRYEGDLRVRVAIEPGAGTWWEQRVLPRLARRAQADVLFCPAYSGPIWNSPPMVVAIHDVSFAAHPEWFRWREGLRRRMLARASARRAARVVTLTEFSRREIVEHLGVSPDRVEVVNPGVAPIAGPRGGAPVARGREPLVLYVGSVFNRRHVPETIRGFARLGRRHPEAVFKIVGDNRTFPRIDLQALVDEHDRVEAWPYAPDAVLADLYQRARAFVFLSEYEGFGLTPLEALAAGVPIVVLETAVAREVYGEAAIYVPDPDPRLIERALEQALYDEATRDRVLGAARAVVERYSWPRCADRVLAALTAAAS